MKQVKELTPRDKADEFFERMMALATKYDIAAMKADEGKFEISIYTDKGVESFCYREDQDPNK